MIGKRSNFLLLLFTIIIEMVLYMKNSKRKSIFIIIFLAVIIISSFAIFLVNYMPKTENIRGENYFVDEGYYYQLNEKNYATLNKIENLDQEIVYIPETINGYKVKALGYVYDKPSLWNRRYKGLFEDNEKIKEVNIPENVEVIEQEVFKNSALKRAEISGEIKEMGSEAFAGCENLEKIVFQKGITTVPSWTFSRCNSLKNISLSESVKKIESGAFYSCKNLERIDIYDKCTSIDGNAFQGCDNLTIYGIKGSYAEQYANEHNMPFKALK